MRGGRNEAAARTGHRRTRASASHGVDHAASERAADATATQVMRATAGPVVAPLGGLRPLAFMDSMANYELLDLHVNRPMGPEMGRDIRLERRRLKAIEPWYPWHLIILVFEQVIPKGLLPAAYWTVDEVMLGDHIRAFRRGR